MRARTSARTTLIAVGGALALLTLAACGGSSTATDSSAPAPAASGAASPATSGAANGADPRAAFAAYRDCMSQNGVTLPDRQGGQGAPPSGAAGAPPSGAFNGAPPSGAPGVGGPGAFPLPSGIDQATFDKAQKACASLRPQFGNGGGPGQIDATALAAFKSCLGDHDVKVGDGQDFMRQLDRTDPKVSAALKTCSPLLPQPDAPAASPSPSAS